MVRQFMHSRQSEQLVRELTPNRWGHVVMISLLDSFTLPASVFAALRYGRWRVEEAFPRLKNRLELDAPSALSWHAANQPFGATRATFDDLDPQAAYVAADAHLDPDSPWKISRNLVIDKIKRQIGRLD